MYSGNPRTSKPTSIGLGIILSVLGILWSFGSARAAFEFVPVGAEAGGQGDVLTALASGGQGLFWNPAAASWTRGVDLFLGYDRPFGLDDLETHTVAGVSRLGRLGVGVTYQQFGFSLYMARQIGWILGYRASERAGLGVRVRGLTLEVKGTGRRQWIVFDLGVRAELQEGLFWGLSAWNAGGTQTGLLGQGGMTGVGLGLVPGVIFMGEVRKEAGRPTGLGVGLSIDLRPELVIRMGAGGQPERITGGIGIRRRGFEVDYAALYHSVLGITHRLSIHLGK